MASYGLSNLECRIPNFPNVFGPISGDCTTPSNTSAVITC